MSDSMARVTAAIQGREPDRVPWTPLLGGASRRIYGASFSEWSRDGDLAAQSLIQAHNLLQFDVISSQMDLNVEAADFGQEIKFPLDDPPDPDFKRPLIETPEDYVAKVQPFDPSRGERMSEHLKMCDILVNEKGAQVPVLGFIYGPLGVLSVMRGPERLMADIFRFPEEVHHALGVITGVLENYVRLLSQTGVYGIWIETLFAAQAMMNKHLWLKTEGPYARRLAQTVRGLGLPVWAHSSGVGVFIDAHMETLEPEAMSCAFCAHDCAGWPETKAAWGQKTTLIGYLAPPKFLYLGTPDQVREECGRIIRELAPGGRFILAPGWEFPPNASILNAQAMREAVEIHGRYSS